MAEAKKYTTQVSKKKIRLVDEMKDLIKHKKTVLVTSIKGLPAAQFQEISKKIRDKAVVKVPKKSLLVRAIEESGNKEVKKLEERIDSDFAIMFSDVDSFELAGILLKSKTPAKAKPGQEAPKDIEVSAGMTELVPGPAISELGAVGLKTKVTDGKLEIVEDKIIVKQGEKISETASSIMGKLGIKPFSNGFIPLASFDSETKTYYAEISIDTEGIIEELKYSAGKALPFALEIGYITEETVKVMISKASAQEKKLIRIINGEPEEVPEESSEAETPEESKEEKEEPKVDAAAGLGALFG